MYRLSIDPDVLRKRYLTYEEFMEGGEKKEQKDNVYKLIHPAKFDDNTLYTHRMILQYYQVIPKYYLLNSDINVLVYNAKTGSGKSIAGVNMVLDWFNSIRIREFNRMFIQDEFTSKASCGNIFVVSVWSGIAQIVDEFFRPEFGYVDKETSMKLRKIHSPIKEEREAAQELRHQLIIKLKKYAHFYGYQAFFNACLGDALSKSSLIQDIDSLVAAYNNGTIDISDSFKEQLRNSIIVVDEMQKLYSADGMNSYGFCLMLCSKLAKELNIKIMLMSGTVFNSSSKEIVDVLNIIRPDRELIPYDQYLRPTSLIEDVTSWDFKQEKLGELIRAYERQFIYYSPESRISGKPKIIPIDKMQNFWAYHDENNTLAMVFDKLPNLPQEIYIGSTVISDDNDIVPFMTYQCMTSGAQSTAYKEYIEGILSRAVGKDGVTRREEIDEDDNKNTISIRDAYIPKTDRLKHGIIESGGAFIGKFLKLENLKNYSTIGYNLTKLVMENAFHNEKTIVYHNKLKNFGIMQYGKILEANGCIGLEDRPKDDTLCKRCRCTYEIHNLPMTEKIKHRCCNNFTPIRYAVLTGDASDAERDSIKLTFNSRINTYGDRCSCVFVSNVAYSGVSFLNTNNLVMISCVSDISKWKQIAARIVRTKSHAALPPNKQVAKIYTFIVNLPDEKKLFPKLKKYTLGERYYAINVKENNAIDGFVKQLSKSCVGDTLFNHPDDYKPTPEEQKRLMNMFVNDVQHNLATVVDRIFIDNVSRTWSYEAFIRRLMDSDYITYFFDLSAMSEDTLKNLIISLPKIKIFRYTRPEEDENLKGFSKRLMQKLNKMRNSIQHAAKISTEEMLFSDRLFIELSDNITEKLETLAIFPFNTIATAVADPKALIKLFDTLDQCDSFQSKIKLLQQIMKYVGKRYNLLADRASFWDCMYDIHNEHYPDDDQNFFKNHMSKDRNKSKMDGCYFGDYIIFKDGTYKIMDYRFPNDLKHWDKIPYLFRITCRATTESSPFYLNLVVIEKNDNEVVDGRKMIKGTACTSYKGLDKLLKLFPETKDAVKKLVCRDLLQAVIDKQANSDTHSVYSPFEK